MKWLIASDIHGSAWACRLLLQQFSQERANRLLLLGDLLYHGPRNSLPRDYAPKEVADLLNGCKNQIFCVRGNCEAEVDQMMLHFPVLAEYCLLPVTGEEDSPRLFATHGHRYNLDTPPPLGKNDILLHGHTHVPACQKEKGLVYINPGSVSIPKENSPYSYITMENGEFLWKQLENGEIYHRFSCEEEMNTL